MWSNGIWSASRIPIYLYLASYYAVNLSIIQFWCSKSCKLDEEVDNEVHELGFAKCSNTTLGYFDSIKSYECSNYKTIISKLDDKEAAFTRLITFLLGFYVSFTIGRWWRKITSIPQIDEFCIYLNSFIWTDPNKEEHDIYIRKDIDVKQFKHTLVRYLLLSWAMVLSNFRGPLATKLKRPIDFNNKGLMNYSEYMRMASNKERESWHMKWAIPISWSVSLLSEAIEVLKGHQQIKIKEHKEIIGSIRRFQTQLQDIFHYSEYQTPDLVHQAIRAAVSFWMIMGVFSSQGLISKDDGVPLAMALIMNFPLSHVIKYILILSWVKSAFMLENPFGSDR